MSVEDLKNIFGLATIVKQDAFVQNKLYYQTGFVVQITNRKVILRKHDGDYFTAYMDDIVEIRRHKSEVSEEFRAKQKQRVDKLHKEGQ